MSPADSKAGNRQAADCRKNKGYARSTLSHHPPTIATRLRSPLPNAIDHGAIIVGAVKEKIHPKWFAEARVSCACGNTFTTGSTLPEIHVEICSACHPLFTGTQKFVDTAGRVDKFNQRLAAAEAKKQEAAERKRQRELAKAGA